MKYIVVIEDPQMVEVEAESETQAIEQVQKQILAQNPRSIARLSVAREIIIVENTETEVQE